MIYLMVKSPDVRSRGISILERFLIGFSIHANYFIDFIPKLKSLYSTLKESENENIIFKFIVMMKAAMKVHSGYPELYIPLNEDFTSILRDLKVTEEIENLEKEEDEFLQSKIDRLDWKIHNEISDQG